MRSQAPAGVRWAAIPTSEARKPVKSASYHSGQRRVYRFRGAYCAQSEVLWHLSLTGSIGGPELEFPCSRFLGCQCPLATRDPGAYLRPRFAAAPVLSLRRLYSAGQLSWILS